MTFSEWWKSVAAHRMTWSRKMAAEYAWDAARADIEAVLVSKHGGEPLALLEELDQCRRIIEAQNQALAFEREQLDQARRERNALERENIQLGDQLAASEHAHLYLNSQLNSEK